eukprot:1159246-Pelagomonas_calceolata.AAC.3
MPDTKGPLQREACSRVSSSNHAHWTSSSTSVKGGAHARTERNWTITLRNRFLTHHLPPCKSYLKHCIQHDL